jgi:hypothetical protein
MDMKTLLALLLVMSSVAFAAEIPGTVYGPFRSNIGEIEIQVKHQPEGPNVVLEVLLKQTGNEGKSWTVIHQMQVNRVEYIASLMPDESSFVVVWDDGSAFETVIFQLKAPGSVVVQLDAVGKDFPEIIRAGVEDTRFVIIRNASAQGDVLDIADIYAMQDGTYKREERISYEQKLTALARLSRKIDQAAAERRKGIAVESRHFHGFLAIF